MQFERLVTIVEKSNALMAKSNDITHIKIEDVNMPFVALIGFLLKVALAGIPAAIILAILYTIFISFFVGVLL